MAANKKDSKLITDLTNADKLDEDKRMEYISMAHIFMNDFAKNINRTSIEMDEIEPLGMDLWREFLNYPVVRKYIKSFKDEQINLKVDEGLMKGDNDVVSIRKMMNENGPTINNSNIILIRLPEKSEF